MRALLALIAVVAAICWGVWFFSGTYVDAGHVGVMYSARAGANTKNGLVINSDGSVKTYRPGRHYVGFGYEMYEFPLKPQLAVYSQDARSGALKQSDGIRITTSDTAVTVFDIIVRWHVEPANLGLVFEKFGKTDLATIQSQHIRRALQDAANDVGREYDAQTLIAPALEKASDQLTQNLKEKLESKGIAIYQAAFKLPYPEAKIQTKINQRINIETATEIAKIERQKAEIELKTASIMNSAEAQARQIKAVQTGTKSLAMMSLDADEEAVDRWDGHLPQVPLGKGVNVVVGGNGVVAMGGQ